MIAESKPFAFICISVFNEERSKRSFVFKALKYVDRAVVYDDSSVDLTGEVAGGLGVVVVRHE